MRNACLLLNKDVPTGFEQVFLENGYVFDEIRILNTFDDKKILDVLQAVKAEYDNTIFLTDKQDFTRLFALFSGAFPLEKPQTIRENAVFAEKNKSCFLLSVEDACTIAKTACIPYLQKKYGERYQRLVFRSVGITQSHVDTLIAKCKAVDKGYMRYVCRKQFGETVVQVFYSEKTPKSIVNEITWTFADGLQEGMYAMEDVSLEGQLIQLLKLRGIKISVAESFTGGGIAKKLTSVSGASEVYFEGLNTYNEGAKIKRLGVLEKTLRDFGAVSEKTAYEMASGLIATGDCDVSIATTGLAGPNSDQSGLPVGLCFIAVGTREKVYVYRYQFDGSREGITNTAITYALFLAYKHVKNI